MSATNQTTNYGLPIFIETDKPAWLVDFNGAMRSIDAQMKTNADAIATKSPILTFNDTAEIDFTKSGDIITANLASGVSDKVGRALVTPISTPASEQLVGINTAGQQQNLTIGSGLYNNAGILQAIDLNLDIRGTAALTITGGAGTVANPISYALNADRSIGKIYGAINVTGAAANTEYTLVSDLYVKAPGSQMFITGTGIAIYGLSPIQNFTDPVIRIDADGRVNLIFNTRWVGAGNYYIRFFANLLFFSDFGDTPQP